MKNFLTLLAALVAAFAAARASAIGTPDDNEPTGVSAAKTTLTYDGAPISSLHGGLGRSSTFVGNLHLRSLLDLQRGLGWADTIAFVDALWIHGGQPDRFVGDALGVNNLSAPPGAQIEELWVEHEFLPSGISALAGLYDLNSEFYRVQSGGLFLNSSFGIGPEFAQSGVGGPSIFPRTSLGVRLAYKPSSNVVLRTAVLDGVPLIRSDDRLGSFRAGDGLLYVAELAMLERPGSGKLRDQRTRVGRNAMLSPYQGKLAFGAWHYTARFDRLDPTMGPPVQRGSSGFYLVGDRVLVRDETDPDHTVSAFVQLGSGDASVDRFGTYLGTGVVISAPLRGRSADEVGIALAIARNGASYRRLQVPGSPTTHTESTVELTYLAQVTSGIAMQPDLQYVIHPGTDRSIPNALVFTLSFEMSMDL
ncbi:MAG: carbohydrate porin [Rhodanobacter sp.]